MNRNGLLIGEIAVRSGVSRKALRLYEAAGILSPPIRTASGYRVFASDTLPLLAFVRKAKRLGFTLDEIKEIVSIRHAGRSPCPHVRELVRRKARELDRRLADLVEVRDRLRAVLKRRQGTKLETSAVCPHIERSTIVNDRQPRRAAAAPARHRRTTKGGAPWRS